MGRRVDAVERAIVNRIIEIQIVETERGRLHKGQRAELNFLKDTIIPVALALKEAWKHVVEVLDIDP